MIPIVRGAQADAAWKKWSSPANWDEFAAEEQKAREIVEQVRARGDQALLEYERRFGWSQADANRLQLGATSMAAAWDRLDGATRDCLQQAADNIRAYQQRCRPQSWFEEMRPGVVLGQKVTPVERVGVYVPGGQALYPSTVLMTVIPARVAGVDYVALVTPPDKQGAVADIVLGAAHLAGVDVVYRVGGAHAVAALAFGTESVERVDMIVGPGGPYVVLAKRAVFGQVGIESLPGPSEVLVIADDSPPPAALAADLMAQAEHGADSSAILVTTSGPLAEQVAAEVKRRVDASPRRDLLAGSLRNRSLIVVVDDLQQAAAIANRRAPEHLLVATAHPWELLPRIRNAGAICLGVGTTVPLGDYVAGPSHVLPTGATARFDSALSADTFMKKSSLLSYVEPALDELRAVSHLAEIEGLPAHADCARLRAGADDEGAAQ